MIFVFLLLFNFLRALLAIPVWGTVVNVKFNKCPGVFCLHHFTVWYSLWPSLCSRSQIKHQQSDAINKDMTGLKSLTAVRGLLKVISYGIDTKADAVLSFFIIANYLQKWPMWLFLEEGCCWWTLTQKKTYKRVISELRGKNLSMPYDKIKKMNLHV